MTGRDDQGESQRPMPPIPDGGLSQAMPDWLRRPPAWRFEPAASAESPVEKSSGNDAIASEPPDLPLVDDSVIDPRDLILAADLPAWLRSLGVPQPPTPQAPVGPIVYRPPDPEPVEGEGSDSEPRRSAIATDHQRSVGDHEDAPPPGLDIAGGDPPRPAFRPRRLGNDVAAPIVVTLPPRPVLHGDDAPTSSRLTLVLAVALGIAILVIVVLVAV